MSIDLTDGRPLSDSVDWIASALTGAAATAVAVLAVATLGGLMLAGRLPARRAAEVIVGCFVLFSARLVAGALLGHVQQVAPPAPPVATPPLYTPTVPRPVPYDPYAGASVPHAVQNGPIVK